MSGITHIYIPAEILGLRLKMAEAYILALAVSFGRTGITMSNTRLAEGLYINRKNVNEAVSRLKRRGLLMQQGQGLRRRLVASTDILRLAECNQSPQQGDTKHPTRWYETPHITKGTEYELNTLSGGKAGFVAPSLEEVEDFVREKELCIDAAAFHQYFSESG